MFQTERVLAAVACAGLLVASAGAAEHPLRRVIGAAAFSPPECVAKPFDDVEVESDYCPWIRQLAVVDGISAGCVGSNYCPDLPVTRAQLAVYLEKAMRGTPSWDVNADKLDGLDSSDFVTAASLNWASLRRRFYLTQGTSAAIDAPDACNSGFHMASLWEIFDMSQLKYDTVLGSSTGDSGQGPTTESGWIRTGNASGTAGSGGIANCSGYTSETGNGTAAQLLPGWSTAANSVSPWFAGAIACTTSLKVWCVED